MTISVHRLRLCGPVTKPTWDTTWIRDSKKGTRKEKELPEACRVLGPGPDSEKPEPDRKSVALMGRGGERAMGLGWTRIITHQERLGRQGLKVWRRPAYIPVEGTWQRRSHIRMTKRKGVAEKISNGEYLSWDISDVPILHWHAHPRPLGHMRLAVAASAVQVTATGQGYV